MKILTGRIAGKNHFSEVDSIAATNSLVTGMTRSGKSYKLRTMAEALEDANNELRKQGEPTMPTWIIDPEDEFYSLREKYPFLLFGEGGEATLSVASARLMARNLLEWGVSAVLSLAALEEDKQHDWVFNFFDELMKQPRSMWRRAVIITDEAHLFAPNGGHGKSEALRAARNLARRGLKRGLIPMWATQRLASLSVAVSASSENMLVGRTTRTADQEQAAKLLGVSKTDKVDLAAKLRSCKRGNFFAVGPAYGEDIVVLETIPAKTTHFSGKIGQEPERLPLPQSLEYLRPKLEAMRGEITILDQTKDETQEEELSRLRVIVADRGELHAPVITGEQLAEMQTTLEMEREEKETLARRCEGLVSGIGVMRTTAKALEENLIELTANITQRSESIRATAADICQHGLAVLADNAPGAGGAAAANPEFREGNSYVALSRREEKILTALRECEAMNMETVSREVAAQVAGLPKSGQFWSECARLVRRGFIANHPNKEIGLTPAGKVMIPASSAPLTQAEMLSRLRKSIGEEAGEVIDILVKRKGLWIPMADVCKQARFGPSSDKFRKIVTKLRAYDIAEYRQEDKTLRIAARILMKEKAA